jgi:uncharacterized membrane protein
MRIASWGHAVFAVTLVALGVMGLIQGHFTSTWTGVPSRLPAYGALTYVSAMISIACGIGLLFARTALLASRVLLAYLLLWLLLFRVSHIAFAPKSIDTWWGLGDTAVMLAATWVLCGWFADAGQALRLGRVFYALALIPFGIAHFTNLNDTAPLVPAWLPWHVGFAYFTGAAFIAASIAVLSRILGRLGATLSACQLALFTLLVWGPVVVAGATPPQWTEFVTSWVLTAAAWVVADSYRGTGWLAVGSLRIPALAAQPALRR